MIVGRDVELATIHGLIDGLDAQTPFVLGVSGAPGSGRSALLDQARRIAVDLGATVLATRGAADDTDMAFGGLLSLLRPFERELDELAGDLTGALRSAMAMRRDQVDPLDVRLAVFRVLTVAAERRPVAVVVDDADRLDAATLDALRFAFGRLGVDRVGAITASLGHRGPLDGVATHRVALAPLGVETLSTIVESALPCTAAVATTCAEWADGSPLVALELARSFTDDERTGKAPLPAVPRPTSRIVETLSAELEALTEPARRAAVVVAADRSGSTGVVGAALTALGESSAGLDEAERSGVLVVDDDGVAFRHPLLRPLAYRLVAAASRRAAHRAIATALVEPQQAAERAWQLVASCAGPDDEVAGLLDLVAADALRRGALGEAAATFERAARLSVDPSSRDERIRRGARAYLDALSFDDALRLTTGGVDTDDAEAVLLACEAVERRDGAVAALAWAATREVGRATRADLLVSTGAKDEARRALGDRDEHADDAELWDAVCAALDAVATEGAVDRPASVSAAARRAHRRRLRTAADHGIAPRDPATVDELVAAAVAAQVNGRVDEARASCARAEALLPVAAGALGASIARLASSLEADAPDPVLALLTPAERRVAEAVADGRTNREAAAHLYLSVKTVDFHLQSVYRKLAVRSRTELAVRLARGGRS